MKRWMKVLLITCGSIISLWIIGRATKVFEFNNAAVYANAPTIKKGDLFFSSTLLKPKRFDFICFQIDRPEAGGRQINFFRLCGLPGDVIEIREGDLYVNSKFADNSFQLQHDYNISRTDFKLIKNDGFFDERFISEQTGDTLLVPLPDAFVQQNKINAQRLIIPREYNDPDITQAFSSDWNQDHFGPVKVRVNHYFVLGDNRHEASDSRFVGFIGEADFTGTVIGKK